MEFSTTTFALIAIISVLGLVGVIAVDTMSIVQDAEAKGCPFPSKAANASRTRCVQI